MDVIYIWGVKFNLVAKEAIVSEVASLIKSGRKGIHLTGVNHETVIEAQSNEALRQTILSSDFVNIDNFFVLWGLRRLGYNIPDRAATPDIFEMFLDLSNRNKWSIYLLGAEEWVVAKTAEVIKNQYPDIIISGYHNGFDYEEEKIVKEISNLAPNFLFIALPSPRKELFINKYKFSINAGVLYGVGGAFDAKSGRLKRAPKWMQKIGLEGFYRVIRRPLYFAPRIKKSFIPFIRLINIKSSNDLSL